MHQGRRERLIEYLRRSDDGERQQDVFAGIEPCEPGWRAVFATRDGVSEEPIACWVSMKSPSDGHAFRSPIVSMGIGGMATADDDLAYVCTLGPTEAVTPQVRSEALRVSQENDELGFSEDPEEGGADDSILEQPAMRGASAREAYGLTAADIEHIHAEVDATDRAAREVKAIVPCSGAWRALTVRRSTVAEVPIAAWAIVCCPELPDWAPRVEPLVTGPSGEFEPICDQLSFLAVATPAETVEQCLSDSDTREAYLELVQRNWTAERASN